MCKKSYVNNATIYADISVLVCRTKGILHNQLHHILCRITALNSNIMSHNLCFQRQRNRHLISPVFPTGLQKQHYLDSEKDIHDLNN